MLHHNWDTCREGEAQNAIFPHNKETWAVPESGNAVCRKWFLLSSERCWGGNLVRERGCSREKKAFVKSLAICENIEWEDRTCQDWTFREFNLLGKTYANWTVNTMWNMISCERGKNQVFQSIGDISICQVIR